jgi:hypothetical protein
MGIGGHHMFTTYGVCQTLISDRGSEFTYKCAAELCKLLEVTQEFTPLFLPFVDLML